MARVSPRWGYQGAAAWTSLQIADDGRRELAGIIQASDEVTNNLIDRIVELASKHLAEDAYDVLDVPKGRKLLEAGAKIAEAAKALNLVLDRDAGGLRHGISSALPC